MADAAEEEEEDNSGAVRLYQSVYETALRQQVPRQTIDEIIRIYSYDVDFQRRVQPGDSFEVLVSRRRRRRDGEGKADVLYAALTVGGETRRYYRFQTPDDGVVDYYDETGKSAKKFLVRKPLGAGIMRSGYGWRRHPILGYSKMHTGVDWAAPRGTPIYASGNGVVDKAGWEGGYGKYVRIRHTNGYETAYGHMSAFARGIGPGTRVRQGQVIGYVGSTGLSTGSARPLRDHGQRPLRRSDAHQAAARPQPRRPAARGLRAGARPLRQHDEPRAGAGRRRARKPRGKRAQASASGVR